MKVSLKWLRDYIDVSLSATEIANSLTMAGIEVKSTQIIGGAWDGVVVGQIVSVVPHPNAVRLTLPTVDVGNEKITVVCGAPNVRTGDKVAFARVGTELIDGYTGERARLRAATLCRAYWYPLYVYVRRRGHSPEEAQDLTQEFFARFLQKEYFRLTNPARGRFRTFLLHSLQNFLANEWKRAQRGKRGGGVACLSLDAEDPEHRYARELAVSTMTPERAYEKRWAMTLLDRVLADLQQEYIQAGHGRVFEEMSGLLWGKDAAISYARIGQGLGMSEGTARGAMHRLRARYRDRLRAEVAHTVTDLREVDEELRYLIAVLGQRE